MAAFARDDNIAVLVAVKRHAKVHHIGNDLRPFGDKHAHGFFIAVSGSGDERVADMIFKAVGGLCDSRDAALGKPRAAAVDFALDDERDAVFWIQAEGAVKAGKAAADDDDIVGFSVVFHVFVAKKVSSHFFISIAVFIMRVRHPAASDAVCASSVTSWDASGDCRTQSTSSSVVFFISLQMSESASR